LPLFLFPYGPLRFLRAGRTIIQALDGRAALARLSSPPRWVAQISAGQGAEGEPEIGNGNSGKMVDLLKSRFFSRLTAARSYPHAAQSFGRSGRIAHLVYIPAESGH
jgi:hypothetical protein